MPGQNPKPLPILEEATESNRQIRNLTTAIKLNLDRLQEKLRNDALRLQEIKTGLKDIRSQLIDGGTKEDSVIIKSLDELIKK